MSKNPTFKSNDDGDEEDDDDVVDDDDGDDETLRRGCCVKRLTRHMARVPFEGGGGGGSDCRCDVTLIEGSLEVKLPTIWRDEKQSRAEAQRRGRLEERRSEEKE